MSWHWVGFTEYVKSMTADALSSPDEQPYRLYRWFDADGVLLYIGITNDLATREQQHWSNSWWTLWADRVEADPEFRSWTKSEAMVVERRAIDAERPVFNRSAEGEARAREYVRSRGLEPADLARKMQPSDRVTFRAGKSRELDPFSAAICRGMRAERARQNMSQTTLAARMGWSRQVASNTETGVRVIPAYELPALCEALGVTLRKLVQDAPASELRKLGL